MRTTPPLPGWIRSYRHQTHYTNIYELLPDEPRLYGTESLYGDWNGATLLLAKHFSTRQIIEARIDAGDPDPFRHDPEMRTNRYLQELVGDLDGGALYGSALAGLLRNDDDMLGALPAHQDVMLYAAEVLRWVISQMPNLRAIVCLGPVGWECAASVLDLDRTAWKSQREARMPVIAKGIQIHALASTARFSGGRARVEAEWAAMKDRVRRAA